MGLVNKVASGAPNGQSGQQDRTPQKNNSHPREEHFTPLRLTEQVEISVKDWAQKEKVFLNDKHFMLNYIDILEVLAENLKKACLQLIELHPHTTVQTNYFVQAEIILRDMDKIIEI